MTSVVLQGLEKRYGALQVVHGIDLAVAPNEFLVLVGPSGCGKSTTLRMVAGLEEISGGQLEIGGRVMNRVAPKDRDVAMVFQNYALYPHLDVAENIAFGLRIRRTPKPEIDRLVTEVAGILGLTDYLDRKPADLSGGQRQRVAMGRAIVRHPKVFLFDEPLSNLDAKLRTQMRAEIKRLHRRLGVTSLYVTHDQVEAMTLADRIVVMNDGRIEQIGTPMELFLNPVNTFVAGFLGSPPMNQFDAVVGTEGGALVARFAGQTLPLPPVAALRHAEGREIIVGIRPEYAVVGSPGAPGAVAMSVDLVETLGSEALIHASVGAEPFILKADTQNGTRSFAGADSFSVPADLIRVFDKATGRTLSDRVEGVA